MAKDFINLILNITDFVYFRHMLKTQLVVLMAVLFVHGFAQKAPKLPRKIRGVYEGQQEAYKITQHNQNIDVSATQMIITLNKEEVTICYQNPNYCPVINGRIKEITKMGKGKNKTWQISVNNPNSALPESIEVNGSKKQMMRKGVFPQPDTILKRSRKK